MANNSQNPFYTLTDSRNYALRKLFKKKGLDPEHSMQEIIRAAAATEGYVPKLKFPSAEKKREIVKEKRIPVECRMAYLQGMNAMIEYLVELNTEDAYVQEEAKHKINRPIDLTLRQLAITSKVVGREFRKLLHDFTGGASTESIKVKTWKSEYLREKNKHEETKDRLGQIYSENKAAKRTIAELRRLIHQEGIQDPTLQITIPKGKRKTRTTDKDDVQHEDTRKGTGGSGCKSVDGDDSHSGHHNG